MLKSMTGFGRGKYENAGREYIVEIKGVNYKYNDIIVRLPRNISYLEDKVKKEVISNIARGKIDISITFNNYSQLGKEIRINKELAKIYIAQLQELADETSVQNDISVINIAKFPDVLEIQNIEHGELIWNEMSKALNEAIDNFIFMREAEGNKLLEDIKKRLDKISSRVNEISKYSTRLIEEYVVKLEARIKEILKTDIIDKSRIAQEVVIYADKCSIEEEITRLKSHMSQFEGLLNNKEYIPLRKEIRFYNTGNEQRNKHNRIKG